MTKTWVQADGVRTLSVSERAVRFRVHGIRLRIFQQIYWPKIVSFY